MKKIGNLSDLETDNKGNMVEAINELINNLDSTPELSHKLYYYISLLFI